MVKTLRKLHENRRACVWNILNNKVKKNLDIKKDTHKTENIVTNFGNLGVKEFQYSSCCICQEKVLPSILEMFKSKLLANATLENLIYNCHLIIVSPTYYDLAGCLILHEQHTYAGPNSCRFIERPTEHYPHNKFRADQPPPLTPSATSSSKSSSKNTTTSGSLPRHKNQVYFFKKSNVSDSNYVI